MDPREIATPNEQTSSKAGKDEDGKSKPVEKLNIFEGVEYIFKKDELAEAATYYASKMSMSETINVTITTSGQLDRVGRKFVSERASDTAVTHLDKGVATGSCYTDEAGSQYQHQQLTSDAVHRVCTSKKLGKFLKAVVPIMEEELERTIVLDKII